MKFMRLIISLVLATMLGLGNPFLTVLRAPVGEALAKSPSFSSSRSSFSSKGFTYGKSSSWTPSTQGTWNRNGGGLFGGSKPSAGYEKPTGGGPPASGYQKPSPISSSPTTGYAKPSLKETPKSDDTRSVTPVQPGSTGYAKPSLPTTPGSSGYEKPSTSTQTGTGYTKPPVTSGSAKTFSGATGFDKGALAEERKKRSKESLDRFKSEQSKFQKPYEKVEGAESNPLYDKAKVYSGFDYRTHYDARDNYYRAQGYQPPAYAYSNFSPGYGIFSGLFLFWMLDHMSNRNVAATAYHHQDDPGFKKWRQEVETQAKDNAELKAKLAEMDRQIQAMKNTPKDPSYLPPGVPAEVAVSAAALANKKPDKPVVRFAAGQAGGWYDRVATLFKTSAEGFDLRTLTTSGSLENLKLLAAGEADLAIIQSDVLAMMEKQLPGTKLVSEQSTLYNEFVQLIAHRDSGIKSLKDIDPAKHSVYVGPKGSGTSMTWQGLRQQEERLRKVSVRYGDYMEGLAQVEKDPKVLMLFVGGLNSDFLKKAEEDAKRTGNLRLVNIEDKRLVRKLDPHGNPIYKVMEIPKSVYPELQKGWFFSGDVDTLAVEAVLVLRSDWAKQFGPEAMDALSRAIQQIKPEVQRLVNKVD